MESEKEMEKNTQSLRTKMAYVRACEEVGANYNKALQSNHTATESEARETVKIAKEDAAAAAKKAEQDAAAAKKAEQDEAAKKAEQDEAAKKAEQDEAAKKAEQDEAAKKEKEAAAAAAAAKKAEQDAATKKKCFSKDKTPTCPKNKDDYREQARTFHPDKNEACSEEATQKMAILGIYNNILKTNYDSSSNKTSCKKQQEYYDKKSTSTQEPPQQPQETPVPPPPPQQPSPKSNHFYVNFAIDATKKVTKLITFDISGSNIFLYSLDGQPDQELFWPGNSQPQPGDDKWNVKILNLVPPNMIPPQELTGPGEYLVGIQDNKGKFILQKKESSYQVINGKFDPAAVPAFVPILQSVLNARPPPPAPAPTSASATPSS